MTDRGVPVAVLVPLPRSHYVDQGLAEGWIALARRDRPRSARPVPAPLGPTTTELLDDDRGD